jgi:WD40 repeat protein
VWDPRKLNALATKAPVAVETSAQPVSHRHREYGITSITTQQNRVYALSKDSQYIPQLEILTCSIYALSLNHLSHGPTHSFSHPRLRCDTFWIKLAVQNDLLASGSSDGVVVLTSSNPDRWQRGGVVLRGGHSREVSDVAFVKGDTDVNGEGICSVGDDMVVRVWREGNRRKAAADEDERGCGWGWAE